MKRVGAVLSGTHQLYLRGMSQPPSGKTWADFRGRPLEFDFKGPNGVQLRAGEVVLAGASGIRGVIASTAGRLFRPDWMPEMISVPGLSFNIAKDVLTIAMFSKFVDDSGYRITGDNAELLRSQLESSPRSNDSLTYLNYYDGVAYAEWLSEKTGRSFSMPMDVTYDAAINSVGARLKGGYWEWTQTKSSKGKVFDLVVVNLNSEYRGSRDPGDRNDFGAVRLVEDLLAGGK